MNFSFSAGATGRQAGVQFPLGGAEFREEQPLPDSGVRLLRVHREALPEEQAPLHAAPFMAIAGIWRETKADRPPTFAMLTTEPGPDVAPYHDRQVVVLRPPDWAH